MLLSTLSSCPTSPKKVYRPLLNSCLSLFLRLLSKSQSPWTVS